MARIEFLTGSEIESFESVPEFKNSFERDYFFKLPKNIYDRALTLGNDELFCIFTLMYGYFKVSNKFFDFNCYNEDDIRKFLPRKVRQLGLMTAIENVRIWDQAK